MVLLIISISIDVDTGSRWVSTGSKNIEEYLVKWHIVCNNISLMHALIVA